LIRTVNGSKIKPNYVLGLIGFKLKKEKKIVTLVYAAKDTKHTHALVLLKILEKTSQIRKKKPKII